MTNDECRKKSECRSPKERKPLQTLPFGSFVIWAFVILSTFGFRHSSFLLAADWLQFRGGDAGGAAAMADLPITWSAETNQHIAWKVPLPGKGVSGPIVVGGKILLTASSGFKQDRLHVLCFDAASGENLWERQFWATGRTLCHPTSAVAAPTPASDGRRVFAFFSSNDLACLDLEGNLLWYRGLSFDYPHAGNDVGMASSPVVVDETVVVQIENQDDSFAAGLDAATGETRWRHDRDPLANWSSPVAVRSNDGKGDLVLVTSSNKTTAYEPRTGRGALDAQGGRGHCLGHGQRGCRLSARQYSESLARQSRQSGGRRVVGEQ